MRRRPIEKNNGWVKYLANQRKILGMDRDTISGKASWSKTQLQGMTGCLLRHDGVKIELHGPGEYWQSDDLEAIMELNVITPPFFITRRIEKKVESTDRFMIICEPSKHHLVVYVTSQDPHTVPEYSRSDVKDVQMFTPDDVGKWIVLELDAQKLSRSWKMSGVRL